MSAAARREAALVSDLVSCGAFESALTLSGRVGKEALRLTRLTLGLEGGDP